MTMTTTTVHAHACTQHRPTLALALTLLLTLLAGCSDSDVKEVNAWMDEIKRDTRPRVTPLIEPKTFIPFAYSARDAVDPYDANKLLGELARAAEKEDSPLKPDSKRPKEFLESFPLDTMRMVGTMQKGGVNFGLLQIDRSVHQVKVGQRLGHNYGRVTGVTETVIAIKETVQDAGGEWVERTTQLELQESQEQKK